MVAYAVLAALVLLPTLCAVISVIPGHKHIRTSLVILTTLVMMAAALFLAYRVVQAHGHFTVNPGADGCEIIGWVLKLADLAVLGFVIYRGIVGKRWLSPILAVLQLATVLVFELTMHTGEPAAPIAIDYLSLILILLASLIGPLILVFALGYMEEHEAHLHLAISRQPRFFAILFLFLGVMNALAMSDSLLWMYTCWEVTTLCSFLLISHDETKEAVRNAFRTLDLNMLGGLAFILAIVTIAHARGTISLSALFAQPAVGGLTGLFALGIALLCLAGFTKAAQFPFQSWLLGAMVAPTPVSALLHSSTMVKAGVYLIVRLAPVLAGTVLGGVVAFAGAFTFVAASAIAISQRNGKRVLAYSTIANLGLIVCCAGIGTHAALGAAILLIIFHAISKGLLFLCIGTIEQAIGSRDIEDMQGLLKKLPFTTTITVIGMISMLLPPFGVLITKWLAIEAAVRMPVVLIMLILGSAFTVVFWSKWIGIILTMSYKPKYQLERLSPAISTTLVLLLLGVVGASFGIAPLYHVLVAPQLALVAISAKLQLASGNGGLWLFDTQGMLAGGTTGMPLFLILFGLVLAVPYMIFRTKPEKVKPPYFGGELANDDIRGIEFIGPGEKIEQVVVHNYYLASIFGEDKLAIWAGLVALAVVLVMFGVVL